MKIQVKDPQDLDGKFLTAGVYDLVDTKELRDEIEKNNDRGKRVEILEEAKPKKKKAKKAKAKKAPAKKKK